MQVLRKVNLEPRSPTAKQKRDSFSVLSRVTSGCEISTRFDFYRSLAPPLLGRDVGSFPEQRLVIKPSVALDKEKN